MANQDYTSTRTPPFVPQDSNIFRNLRFGNIFSGGPERTSTTAGEVDPVSSSRTPANDRLMELMGNYPESQSPGIMKKIALSMIGMNDPKLSAELGSQPSGEKIDWLNEMELAKIAAEMEQQMAGRELEKGRLGLSEERLSFDIDKFNQQLSPEDKHAMEIEKIQLRSDLDIDEIERRAEERRKTGEIQQADRLDVIAARARDASQLEGKRQEGRETLEGQRQTGRKTLETQRQEGKKDTSISRRSQSDIRTGVVNRAQKLINDRPELAEWITIESNRVTVSPEGREIPWRRDVKGPTPDERRQIIDVIYPEESGQGLVPDSDPTGQIEVKDPDGNEGFIPASQLEEALKQGYTRAQ